MGKSKNTNRWIYLLGFVFLCSAVPVFSQLKFIENNGQWPNKVKFKANLHIGDLFITDSGLLFNVWEGEASEKAHNRCANSFAFKAHAFYLHFKNGNFTQIENGGKKSQEYYNYFYGKDPKKWVSEVYAYNELWVRNLYTGVDMHLYEKDGNLKYDLHCKPNSNIAEIELQYIGADITETKTHQISIHTSVGDLVEQMPKVYGVTGEQQTTLLGAYRKAGNSIFYQLAGATKRYAQVVIDPILVFSTFSGSSADNFGCTATYDNAGNAYAGGTVFAVGLPVTLGAYQTRFGGGVSENLGYGGSRDAAILKFNPTGNTLLFCTYLGGNNNEQPHSMVCNNKGQLYVMGSTKSGNFPCSSTAFDQNNNGEYDFFISQFSSNGTQLLASTLVGGADFDGVGANRELNPIDDYPLLYNYADEFRGEIITNDTDVFIAGVTYSPNFPYSPGNGMPFGEEDGVVFCLNGNLSQLKWSNVIATSGYDALYGLALGQYGDLYAAGGTNSNNMRAQFPQFSGMPYTGGLADGILVRLNKNNGNMMNGIYVGTGKYEQCYFVQTDKNGNAYTCGQTEGSFPKVSANFYQANTGQFIIKYSPNLNTIIMSSSFGYGFNPNLSPSAFLVDRCERIFFSGWGGNVNQHLSDEFTGNPKVHRNIGKTAGLPITSNAYQSKTDGSDFYVAVFAKNMYNLSYATFFGGISNGLRSAEEHVDGGTSRFDKLGIIYQSICAGCGRNGLFPTTPGAYSRSMNSNNCNNAIFKLDFENLNQKPKVKDTFVEIIATQNIDFTMRAEDADVQDTLFYKINWINKGNAAGSDTPVFTILNAIGPGFGMGDLKINVKWNTLCNTAYADTLRYELIVWDKGCPKADTSKTIIKLKIKEPPLVIPPDALCVSFERGSNDLKIQWDAKSQPAAWFKEYELFRINPNGTVVSLQKINSYSAGSYFDRGLINPYVNNYCYYIVGRNICDKVVRSPQNFCTTRELNSPILPTNVLFATVENDKRVKYTWEKSHEPDFKNYEIIKFKRGSAMDPNAIFYRTTDTFGFDSTFDVDKESYCYTIVVADQCGHYSKPSNEGCNVVISGTKKGRPDYYFDLTWQDYINWKNGVGIWSLERQYNNYPWNSIAINKSSDRNKRDANLDYDWGGYNYRVTATSNPDSLGRVFQSQSNWIYLWQAPELWVPNAFTPDLNGINDVWGIVPVFVKTYNLKVFTRWGEKVWETNNKKQQWDGTYKGKTVRDGVFAWYVVFTGWDDKVYKMSGTITVIK